MRLPKDSHFITDGLEAADVVQGHVADCWFMAALSSLAQKLPKDSPLRVKQVAVERVIQRDANSTEMAKAAGVYRFKQGIKNFDFISILFDSIERLIPT